jgi:aerotaxis receptor
MKINLPVTSQETLVPNDQFIYSTTDLKGAITSVNDEFVRISGFTREELLGQNHNMVRHPDMPPEAFADLWLDLKAGRPWQGLVKNRRKDGGFYWVQANVSPIRENGRVVGYGSVRRQADRQTIAQAEAAYRQLRQAPGALFIKHGIAFKKGWLSAMGRLGKLSLLQIMLFLAVAGLAGAMTGTAAGFPEAIWPGFALAATGLLAATLIFLPRVRSDLLAQHQGLEALQKEGDLSVHLPSRGDDLLAELPRRINAFTIDVSTVLRVIERNTSQVAENAHSLRANLSEAVRAQTALSDSAIATAGSLEQVSQAISDTAQNAAEGAAAAAENLRVAESAQEEATATLQGIEQIAEQVQAASGNVDSLSRSSEEIGDITDVIKAIAEQTNLLALNAAIEAARAGEQGRGFAVVADEVRKLAERTTSATGEINQTVHAIRAEIATAVERMRDSCRLTDAGVQRTHSLQESLDAIRTTAHVALERAQSIAAASREQASAAESIASNVEHMALTTEGQSRSVAAMEQLASRFEETAFALQRKLTHFRL